MGQQGVTFLSVRSRKGCSITSRFLRLAGSFANLADLNAIWKVVLPGRLTGVGFVFHLIDPIVHTRPIDSINSLKESDVFVAGP